MFLLIQISEYNQVSSMIYVMLSANMDHQKT